MNDGAIKNEISYFLLGEMNGHGVYLRKTSVAREREIKEFESIILAWPEGM